jgi:hypothetical protein
MSGWINRSKELPIRGAETGTEDREPTGEQGGFAYERPAEGREPETAAAEQARSRAERAKAESQPSVPGGTSGVMAGDPETMEVEKILEDGLDEFYASLPEDVKPVFKRRGEEAAIEIGSMVRSLRANAKRLISIITGWLKTIPGVNRYFLEQEAKIKADRIMALIEEKKRGL